jgi:hypothetical protein
MANKYFNNNFEECVIYRCPEYLYIDDVENFLEDCGDEYISDGVDEPGIYQWSDDDDAWFIANPNIEKKIRAIVEQNSPRQEISNQVDNVSIKWNISVILKTGGTILINSEPISTNEIHEVIDTLLKPSFFGKTINEFKIVAV